jgi:hypothetical protein
MGDMSVAGLSNDKIYDYALGERRGKFLMDSNIHETANNEV